MIKAFAATVLTIVAAAFLLLVALAMNGCSQPTPKPTPSPDAGVVDVFTEYLGEHRWFNCRKAVVAVERDAGAMGDVRGCLSRYPDVPEVHACAVKQTEQYNKNTVACLVRDIGAHGNHAYLAGSNDPVDKAVAEAAREWITSHSAGYVSLEEP